MAKTAEDQDKEGESLGSDSSSKAIVSGKLPHHGHITFKRKNSNKETTTANHGMRRKRPPNSQSPGGMAQLSFNLMDNVY